MRHFGLALVLACVLAGTALAGEIPTSGATAPQPTNSVVTTGEIETIGVAGEVMLQLNPLAALVNGEAGVIGLAGLGRGDGGRVVRRRGELPQFVGQVLVGDDLGPGG